MQQANHILGIDVGATGIKAAIVDIEKGELLNERIKILTPKPATPAAVVSVMTDLIKRHGWQGPVGCGFPAIIKKGVAKSAANIDSAWIGQNVEELLYQDSSCPVSAINDADAAGLAEIGFGVGKDVSGLVIMLTIGSGIGSAVFLDGKLVPNTEFGHLFDWEGRVTEKHCSNLAREREGLSHEDWAARLNVFLHHLDRIFSPDLFILGGGISNDFDQYAHIFDIEVPIKQAQMRNAAGTVGAALFAAQQREITAHK